MDDAGTRSSEIHKDEIKGGLNNCICLFKCEQQMNIIFDMHVGVEEKVMMYSKLCLLDIKW